MEIRGYHSAKSSTVQYKVLYSSIEGAINDVILDAVRRDLSYSRHSVIFGSILKYSHTIARRPV